jgi:hypothetical protein
MEHGRLLRAAPLSIVLLLLKQDIRLLRVQQLTEALARQAASLVTQERPLLSPARLVGHGRRQLAADWSMKRIKEMLLHRCRLSQRLNIFRCFSKLHLLFSGQRMKY